MNRMKCANFSMDECDNVLMDKCVDVPMNRCVNEQMCQCAGNETDSCMLLATCHLPPATDNLSPATVPLPPATCHLNLKAFTIFEMLITLVLSGIIISASLMLYLNYENLIRGKNKQMNSGKETLQFYHIFKHEFDKAVLVTSSGYVVTLIQPVSSSVQYEFEQDFITRMRDQMKDTFFIKVNDLKVIKDEVTGFDKIITMELKNYGEIFPVTLVKEYSNEVMMNNSPHPQPLLPAVEKTFH